MIAHLIALRDKINTLPGVTAFIGQVPNNTPFPFVSLSAPGHDVSEWAPICGPGDELSADVRVMVTDDIESNTYRTLDAVRDLLTPGLRPARLAVAGRHVELTWVRAEFVTTDRSVTYGPSNRHPGYGVESYHIDSQPLPTPTQEA